MSILELLTKYGLQGGSALKKSLEWVIANVPDEAAAAQQALDELASALSPTHLAQLAAVVVNELKDIGSGKLDGRHHPSDSA